MDLILIALLSMPLVDAGPSIWSPAGFPPSLRDVASRLPPDTQAREPDLITYAHEASHFLSLGRPGWHGIYVGNGRRWEIPTPPLATEEVFSRIPLEFRNNKRSDTLYQTYLSQGQSEYWAKQPLMILDEWRAYTLGSLVRQELGERGRGETVAHTETFTRYALVLYRMASELEGYDASEMRRFCEWNLEQCRLIEGFSLEVAGASFSGSLAPR